MKPFSLFSAGILFFFVGIVGAESPKSMPHFELELRGVDYAKILADRKRIHSQNLGSLLDSDEQTLQPVLDLGQRNMDFLKFINSHRDPAHQISLTAEATEPASPIESPKVYNVAIALKAYQDLLKELPAPLAEVLTSNTPFPTVLPIPEADYIVWGLKTDRVYQTAARWLTLKPYLDRYIQLRKSDIRGYYYLAKEPGLSEKLAHWPQLEPKVRAQFYGWLVGSCFNSTPLDRCHQELDALIASGRDVNPYYNKYAPLSKQHYDRYFVLSWPRRDVTYSAAHPEVLRIPFIDPQNPRILSYLRDNIEDEWKWNGWNLRMDFGSGNEYLTAHIRWATGVTPHVEGMNTIVMDQNQPISEYESQWTIRHEFGHILGFPDCYIEFYDMDQAAMVSYQLDISNLMCSRRGRLKQTHFEELKRAYLR
jgi:hypothetical protein